jgi:redox-sensitive bicupin YhaK (pirin superfamily)
VIEIRRAADRTVTYGDGITTRHGFSSGAHYDPANVSFGRLVAHDLHVLAPGAGFDTHRHRGIEIITWVLTGTLLHNGETAVRHGTVQHLSAGDGVEHSERNGGADELRFVQMWLLGEPGEPAYRVGAVDVPGVRFDALNLTGRTQLERVPLRHLYVTGGSIEVAGTTLHAGDEARCTDEALAVTGAGEVLSIVQDGGLR